MKFIYLTLLIISGFAVSRSDEFDVVGPVAPLIAIHGKDVILPCSLKPNISAVDMRVEWFRLDLDGSVVHLYEDHEDKNTNQLQSYRERTEVFKDELSKGNTSLKLSRVQISDEGAYKCFIESKTRSDDITVDLRVEAVGSPPLITVDGFDGSGGLHLQCETKGWYPEPELVWLDSEGVTLTSENTDKQRETDGFRVKHMITVYNRDSKYHCRVTMRHHMMETEIITSSNMFNSWRTLMILISFAVLFGVIAGILIAVFIYRHRELQRKKRRENQRIQSEDERLKSEEEILQSEERRIKNECERLSMIEKGTVGSWKSLLRKFQVNVTLDPDSAHPDHIVSDDGKQVRCEKQSKTVNDEDDEQNKKFDIRQCVLGKEGFTSGCFYYEVEVKDLTVWFMGVTRESAKRKGEISLNPKNGYWMMGFRGEKYQASEYPHIPITVSVKPQRVGVFVDYEEGRVSFYDVESMCHIYSFTDQSFNDKLYPVYRHINPTPLVI
ncbi:butyrophilin subfamily 3 member A3-like [Paramisgurnus dabryanus]|uniref:butyrophilin subfamily 3 member A3-like n=1 Tax=Paramisgurnus dabryanus TaxID=90735 RepID=UPI0031F3486B